MQRSLAKALAVVSVAAFPVFLCPRSLAQGLHQLTLLGRVRTNQGGVLQGGVLVKLATQSGIDVAQQLATAEGEFSFPAVPKAIYIITVTARGFQTFQRTLDLTLTGDSYTLDVYLTRSIPQTQGPAIAPARTDSEAPRKARKEEAKGAEALAHQEFAAAKTRFDKAIKEFPCYARAQAGLAEVLVRSHDMGAAEAALRKAIQCDPDFVASYSELGIVLNSEKRYTEGRTVLEEGLRRAPSTWQFYYQLGVADSGAGQFSQAETDLLKVKEFNIKPPAVLYVRLADVYVKEQAYPKAYEAMQDYLRVAPTGTYAEKIKIAMQRMLTAGLVKPHPDPVLPTAKANP
jgi:Tfp pilus assembly protein PilF